MAIEVVEYVRRVILRNKVRQFALNQLADNFKCGQLKAKVIYYAVVTGCNSGTITKLTISNDDYASLWAKDRDILNVIKEM